VVDYQRQRDAVLDDLRIDYPDVPTAPLVEALKRLDKVCHATPDIHRVLHRSTRGRQSFTVPADEDGELDRDNARCGCPTSVGLVQMKIRTQKAITDLQYQLAELTGTGQLNPKENDHPQWGWCLSTSEFLHYYKHHRGRARRAPATGTGTGTRTTTPTAPAAR
jgi:hypothetical protein